MTVLMSDNIRWTYKLNLFSRVLNKGETRIVLIAQRAVPVLNESVSKLDKAQSERASFNDVKSTGGRVDQGKQPETLGGWRGQDSPFISATFSWAHIFAPQNN